MKNVRLFAVAAAMGMFATTVSAAAPVVTKDGYVATWGEVEEIVKVDVGDKVVAPTATISVVKESRTTDTEYIGKSTTLGVSSLDDTCYVGFTNEVGNDKNHDGLVDTPILTMYPGAAADGWFYTDAKFFPTEKTALYYIGQAGGSIYGARFLAPGAAEVKGAYHATADHKDLASVEEVIAHMTEKGYISKTDTDADGYNDIVTYNYKTIVSDVEEYEGKTLGSMWVNITIPSSRNGEGLLDEGLVNAFVDGHKFGEEAYKDAYGTPVTGVTESVLYTLTTGENDKYVAPYYANFGEKDARNTTNLVGKVLVVRQDRYGDFNAEAILTGADGEVVVGTASDLAGVGIKAEAGKVKIVTIDRNGDYALYATIKTKAQKTWTIQQEYNWDAETSSFASSDVVYKDGMAAGLAAMMDVVEDDEKTVKYDPNMAKNSEGLYHFTAEANTSDKIVINTVGTGLSLDISGINTSKGTMTITAPNGEEYTVSAVKLGDDKWYPAVNNEEELIEFVTIFAGLHTPVDGDPKKITKKDYQYAWEDYEDLLETNKVFSTLTYIDGTKNEKYIPDNALSHYKAKQCTYKVAEGTATAATVTSDADSVDTSVAGVKTLTLTAKVGEEVVGTKEVKVVVAPKYEREYKNGKVVKLTAKWLNGNTYAVYNYDWAAKTYTATFYNADGVTVAATSNGTL